ncbi:MAG: hypothetical protein LBS45_12265 [Synergistaceae bacterium]|nr:hypothetical protein [Synergistaceae bacterium]
MGRIKIGLRVLAFRDATDTEVNIYGYGAYVGNEPCPVMGGIPNPKIVLDSGDVVWGCECWWGAAEAAEERLQMGRRVVNTVPVPRRDGGDE